MIDIAKIKVKAGNGGDGAVSFRREKYIPKGGPDGGDGGNGGDVIFVASVNMATLRDFVSKELFKATDGEPGGKKKMYGKNGEDLLIKVPVGTLVYEVIKGRDVLIGDLSEDGQSLVVAKGGKGGKGNFKFRSSTNQTPLQYIPGVAGEEKELKLEIKLVADVGLVGAPNAGKSTLLNALTHTNVKVANYPFTTLIPNLGVLDLNADQQIVISDIPGLIEGASEGKGLGDEFLRHVERTRVLVQVIDPLSSLEEFSPSSVLANAWKQYEMIRNELKTYGHGLLDKPALILINKLDLTELANIRDELIKLFSEKGCVVFAVSGFTREGLDDFIKGLALILEKNPKKVTFEKAKTVKLYNISNLPNRHMVFDDDKVKEVERKFSVK